MQLSLREAAQQTGSAKSTILRAIKVGRLSATRTGYGGYSIDPAELLRVFPPDRPTPRIAAQSTPVPEVVNPVAALVRKASVEAELKVARELLEVERRRVEEWRAQCEQWRAQADQWREQAQRLLLAAPLVTPPPPTSAPPRSRWRWWARQASGPVGKLILSFLFWVSLSVVACYLFEQPGSSTWQQGLALGGGVFALLMVVLTLTLLRKERREQADRAAELRRREQADRAEALRRRLRGSCRDDGQAGAEGLSGPGVMVEMVAASRRGDLALVASYVP